MMSLLYLLCTSAAITSTAANSNRLLPVPDAPQPKTDHASVVGRVGIGWAGVSLLPAGASLSRNDPGTVTAPTIAARYWMTEGVGLDFGLGLGINSSKTGEQEGPSVFGILLHAGVPIALHSSKHYTFVLAPEANIGFASIESKSQPFNPQTGEPQRQDVSRSGIRFDLGARLGAEIQFGFIGIPELALDASVALLLSYSSAETKSEQTVKSSSLSISTMSLNNPWDFFASSVAARYYF